MTDYDFDIQTIKSKFFIPRHIQQYTASLGDYLTSRRWTLLSLEQLRDYLLGSSGTENYRRMVDAFKDRFATKICGGVNPRHVTILINKLLLSYNLYLDMLVLADSDYMRDLESPIDIRLANLHGFLIVQKGGYEPEPRAYMAKLICSREGGGGIGSILVGAYLATIKQHAAEGVTQIGLLELFRGYENLAGLCAYTKFGFTPFLEYRHPRFSDTTVELPMSVDIETLTMEEIATAAKGRRRIMRLDAERMRTDPIYATLVYTPLCMRGVFSTIEGNGTAEQANLANLNGAEDANPKHRGYLVEEMRSNSFAKLYNRLYVAVYRKHENKIQEIMSEIQAAKTELAPDLGRKGRRRNRTRTASRSRSSSSATSTRKLKSSMGTLRKTRSAGAIK